MNRKQTESYAVASRWLGVASISFFGLAIGSTYFQNSNSFVGAYFIGSLIFLLFSILSSAFSQLILVSVPSKKQKKFWRKSRETLDNAYLMAWLCFVLGITLLSISAVIRYAT